MLIFQNLYPETPSHTDKDVVIVFIGTIQQSWKLLLKNFCLALKEFTKSQKKVVLTTIGYNNEKILGPIISEVGIDLSKFKFNPLGYLTHAKCIAITKQVSINFTILPPVYNFVISAKIFDYIHSEAPILAIIHEVDKTAKLIRRGNLGLVVTFESQALLKGSIKLTESGQFQRNWKLLNQFHHRELTNKLANRFNKITEKYK